MIAVRGWTLPGIGPRPRCALPAGNLPGSIGHYSGLNRSLELEFQVADVDREYARLQGVASQWLMPPSDLPWGHRSIYFRDPDGNFLNFYSLIQE